MMFVPNKAEEERQKIASQKRRVALMVMLAMISKIRKERPKTSFGMRSLAVGQVHAAAAWLGK